jgi:hypothetical protein
MIVPATTGIAISQLRLVSLWHMQNRQKPYHSQIFAIVLGGFRKSPEVKGRKMIVAIVSCFMLSFWYVAIVLKIRSIM